MSKKRPPIDLTSRDFSSIKNDLINYAKVYYPETYQDFNQASFGAMLVDMVAYVGDMLSFYADYQTNETLIDSAVEAENIAKLAKQFGYKYPVRLLLQEKLRFILKCLPNQIQRDRNKMTQTNQ